MELVLVHHLPLSDPNASSTTAVFRVRCYIIEADTYIGYLSRRVTYFNLPHMLA